jgi:hypothetical protein
MVNHFNERPSNSLERLAATNPFRNTKATYLSDEEIYETFVDAAPVLDQISPKQSTPVLITGGKGSGRTHLLRYWSLPVQLLRHQGDAKAALSAEGYLGQYVLLGGLDAARFSMSRLNADAISIAFGYYFDLGVASSFVRSLILLDSRGALEAEECTAFCLDASTMLLPDRSRPQVEDLRGLVPFIADIRKKIDYEINNAAIEDRAPLFEIKNSPGELFFGLAALAQAHFSPLKTTTISYLLDELENLDIPQQRYVQTLVRERTEGVSLIVGARSYGVRTLETLAAGESNREGAEYLPLVLDDAMRGQTKAEFADFCSKLVIKRLSLAGLAVRDPARHFATEPPISEIPGREIAESPAIQALQRHLHNFGTSNESNKLDAENVEVIVEHLRLEQDLLAEKARVLAFYQEWNAGTDLLEAAAKVSDAKNTSKLRRVMSHFKSDFVAQLRREFQLDQLYVSFVTLSELADGNLRNFMNIMNSIHSWSEFGGEEAWGKLPISVAVQRRAVKDASDWFYGDAQVVGIHGEQVRVGMDRLGELLSRMRFAAKPVESSLCAFNVDIAQLSDRTREVLEAAIEWGLLVIRSPRRDRNEERRVTTLQINRMLAPRWDLPIGRRGVVDLRSREVEAMFGESDRDAFWSVLSDRMARLEPPFRQNGQTNVSHASTSLF